MRLIGIDTKGHWHALNVSDMFYEVICQDLIITVKSGESYWIDDIDQNRAEELIKTLFDNGIAELPLEYRLNR